MIWFACKQCNKRHGRAEGLAGTMVFCECGRGNRVPWASTVPEPDPSELPPPRAPAVPIPADPPGPSRSSAPPSPRWAPPAEDDWRPPQPAALRHPREGRRPDPKNCLNHDADAEKTCDDCKCSFCSACVVLQQGRTLCGPCKNFRIRGLHRPSRTSAMAIIAFIVALISGPVCFVLTMMAFGMHANTDSRGGPLGFCLVALVLPVVGLVLGGMALREIEAAPNVGGRALATTGAAAAGASVMWTFMIGLLILTQQVSG